MKKTTLLIVLFLTLNILFCNISSAAKDYDKVPIKIGGANNYPPYEFVDQSNNFRGFNVDIIRAIAIELGLEFELIPNSWQDTVELLNKGEIDAIQGMTITPQLEKIYSFTNEIITNTQNIFILKDTSNISTIKDLRGKRVAINTKDVNKEIVSYMPEITIVEEANPKEAFRMLLSGEVDAYLGNRLTGMYYIQDFNLSEYVKIVGEPINTTKSSITVRSGNDELLQLLNKGLKAIKDNGTYDKIYKKWFGESIPTINLRWRNLLYVALVALVISLGIILIVNYWNQSLKKEVEVRTREIVELNSIAIHNNKMQALGRLSAGIAHELRNPLTSIKAFVDLIPLKFNDENFRYELVRIVPGEIKRLNDLVDSLLDYSRPSNPKPIQLNLEDILSDVLTLLKQKINEKNVKIIKDNVNITLYVDEPQIKQILINIIINSIDAINYDGEIKILGSTLDANAIIRIIDNGVGIPKEMINNLFDPFYSSKTSGYGIGLSVTDRLAKENGGTIKVLSEINKGTEVIICIPSVSTR